MSGKRMKWLKSVYLEAAQNVKIKGARERLWKTMKRAYKPGMTANQVVLATRKAAGMPV